jgi:hypothetical protein
MNTVLKWTGMLWANFSHDSMEVKIKTAAQYYADKHGVQPTICYVNPDELQEARLEAVDGVHVRENKFIRRGHYWIGEKNDDATRR